MIHTGDVRAERGEEVVAASSNPVVGRAGHAGARWNGVVGGRRGVGTMGHGGTQGLGMVGGLGTMGHARPWLVRLGTVSLHMGTVARKAKACTT